MTPDIRRGLELQGLMSGRKIIRFSRLRADSIALFAKKKKNIRNNCAARARAAFAALFRLCEIALDAK